MREAIVIDDHLHKPYIEKELYLVHQDPTWAGHTEFNLEGFTTPYAYAGKYRHDQSEGYNLKTHSTQTYDEMHKMHDSLQSRIWKCHSLVIPLTTWILSLLWTRVQTAARLALRRLTSKTRT